MRDAKIRSSRSCPFVIILEWPWSRSVRMMISCMPHSLHSSLPLHTPFSESPATWIFNYFLKPKCFCLANLNSKTLFFFFFWVLPWNLNFCAYHFMALGLASFGFNKGWRSPTTPCLQKGAGERWMHAEDWNENDKKIPMTGGGGVCTSFLFKAGRSLPLTSTPQLLPPPPQNYHSTSSSSDFILMSTPSFHSLSLQRTNMSKPFSRSHTRKIYKNLTRFWNKGRMRRWVGVLK